VTFYAKFGRFIFFFLKNKKFKDILKVYYIIINIFLNKISQLNLDLENQGHGGSKFIATTRPVVHAPEYQTTAIAPRVEHGA
jgi:hypothetical protein